MPLTVAAYARHSHRRQAESVDQQIAEFERYCQAHQLTLHAQGVFADRAKTGKSDVGRGGLDGLMRFLETRPRPVAAVLLWSSSRLARNADDAAWYKASIRRAGYRLLYVGEESLNTPDPIRHILEAVTEYRDEQYLRDLARDVRRGMLSHAGAGQVISRPPRGYRIQDGHLEIDPAWEGACRRAWQLRAAGYSLAQVHQATRLFSTEYGYSKFFRNRLYTGTLAWGGQEFPGFAPPLCTIEEWARVRASEGKRDHPRRATSPFLLSGRVWCGCGSPMRGTTQVTPSGTYRYYKCRSSPFRPAACGQTSIRAERLEGETALQAADQFTPDRVAPLYDAWHQQNLGTANAQVQEIERLKIQLVEVESAIDQLLSALEAGATLVSIQERLAAREAERVDLRRQLASMPPVPTATTRDPVDITALCDEMQRRLAGDDVAEKRLALRALVERVDATGQAVVVTLRRWPF